jgi:hypothetical protein
VAYYRRETFPANPVTTEPSESNAKEGRIARDVRMVWALGREPAAILPLLRRWLVKIWASRGGGFYGLGYVLTFVALEIKSLSGDLISVSGLVGQVVQYALKFSVESLLNSVSALLWPIHLFRWSGGFGVVVLAIGYVGFEGAIRPLVEARLPELKEARALRELRKQAKAEKAEKKRSRRGNGR